jgi:hypothetical protein
MRYDEASRNMIFAFEHGDRLHLTPTFGTWLRRAGAELIAEPTSRCPCHRFGRGWFYRLANQAAVLAYAIHAAGGPPVGADWRCAAGARRRKASGTRRSACSTCAAPLP